MRLLTISRESIELFFGRHASPQTADLLSSFPNCLLQMFYTMFSHRQLQFTCRVFRLTSMLRKFRLHLGVSFLFLPKRTGRCTKNVDDPRG